MKPADAAHSSLRVMPVQSPVEARQVSSHLHLGSSMRWHFGAVVPSTLCRGPGTGALDWVSLHGCGNHVSPLALRCRALAQPLLRAVEVMLQAGLRLAALHSAGDPVCGLELQTLKGQEHRSCLSMFIQLSLYLASNSHSQ